MACSIYCLSRTGADPAGIEQEVRIRTGYRLKRSFDLVAALAGLLVASPILLVAALAVRVVMGPPVLFRQKRAGLGGTLFNLYKFRTMKPGPGPDAERLTWLGRFLRTSSIDELPQLWNVLKGEMSLAGPRPLIADYLPLYSETQMRRHALRPGITGWTQVNGRNALSWDEKFQLDLWYIDHCSLTLDLEILVLTLWRVVRREGIDQEGQATMEPFQGNRPTRV